MIDRPEEIADALNSLSTQRRLQTFEHLFHGTPPQEIAEELDVARPTIQPYINDFKQRDWIAKTGRSFSVTPKGEAVYQLLEAFDDTEQDYTQLQEFLKENPETIPAEVLEELQDNR